MSCASNGTRVLIPALVACLLPILPDRIQAQVSVDAGDIIFRTTDGETRRLTTSGLDSEPVLSPDGRQIVFVRDTPGETVPVGWGDANAKEIWIVNTDGTALELLVRGFAGDPWEKTLADLSKPRFLSDGKTVVFNSALAVVHGTVNAVDIGSKTVRRITHGSLWRSSDAASARRRTASSSTSTDTSLPEAPTIGLGSPVWTGRLSARSAPTRRPSSTTSTWCKRGMRASHERVHARPSEQGYGAPPIITVYPGMAYGVVPLLCDIRRPVRLR